jgi:hypothetical protein
LTSSLVHRAMALVIAKPSEHSGPPIQDSIADFDPWRSNSQQVPSVRRALRHIEKLGEPAAVQEVIEMRSSRPAARGLICIVNSDDHYAAPPTPEEIAPEAASGASNGCRPDSLRGSLCDYFSPVSRLLILAAKASVAVRKGSSSRWAYRCVVSACMTLAVVGFGLAPRGKWGSDDFPCATIMSCDVGKFPET